MFAVAQLTDGQLAFTMQRPYIHSLGREHARAMYAVCNATRHKLQQAQPVCSAVAAVTQAALSVHRAWQSWSAPSLAEASLLGNPWPALSEAHADAQRDDMAAGVRVSTWAPALSGDADSLGAAGSPDWRLSQDWRLSEGATGCVTSALAAASAGGKGASARPAVPKSMLVAEACENTSHNARAGA